MMLPGSRGARLLLVGVCVLGASAVARTAGAEFHSEGAQILVERGIERLAFVKRYTFSANHVYTEYVNSRWLPGGGIFVLDLRTGDIREVAGGLEGGVFNRFDVSFDARKVVFGWKKAPGEGYRIYETAIDGTGLRQLTFPQKDEDVLVARYGSGGYHHGTDDLHPCYLPDGGIAFVSTRCQYGILCDGGDTFTTKVLYRMGPDGHNARALTNSSVSEASPAVMPNGNILYHRWEYVDKAAGNVKCLWSMRPDGTGSAEVYGNTLTHPETLIYGRPVPGCPNKIVTIGTSHYPNNAMGTVIVVDTKKNIRTREPMTYVTADVDTRAHGGFHFLIDGKWQYDGAGTRGRLFKDPYPVSEGLFIASRKPPGPKWDDPKAYQLVLLDGEGRETPLYSDPEISCWLPYPLVARRVPPVPHAPIDRRLADRKLAACIVTDVYRGLEGVPRGTVKHIRVMEQVPRSWATRTRWGGDTDGMAHSALGLGILGLKVQHGIVPVEDDGSAYFLVPADRNIYFQALDEDFMSVQTERTYVNYMPGETRSCIGCHETPDMAGTGPRGGAATALRRAPSVPGPQPGEPEGRKLLDYARRVQPVWDRNCVKCHNAEKRKGRLVLSGQPTRLWSVSYEELMKRRMRNQHFSRYENENVGSANVQYLPPYTFGSHTSILPSILTGGRVRMRDEKMAARSRELSAKHKDLRVTREEFVEVVNWLDSSCQFYPSYWGKKSLAYKDDPFFRPEVTFAEAVGRDVPERFISYYTRPQRSREYVLKPPPSVFEKEKGSFGELVSEKAKVTTSTTSQWDPQGHDRLVKGPLVDTFAFHTSQERSPWVTLDLGSVKDVRGVLVLNRHLVQRANGLTVSLSTDGREWTPVGKADKAEEFWEVPVEKPGREGKAYGRPARYVKLETDGRALTYLHLRRVSVFGK